MTNDPFTALFGLQMAIIGGLVNQQAVNREKLIDYLMAVVADLDASERDTLYAKFLDNAVQVLERTQFPEKG